MNKDQLEAEIEKKVELARKNLGRFRADDGRSARSISEEAGASANVLSNFLNGQNITYKNLLKICGFLDIPLGILTDEVAVADARLKLYRRVSEMSLEETKSVLSQIE